MSDPGQPSAIRPHDRAERMLVAWTRLLSGHRILLTIILVLLGIVFSRLSAGVAWQADILQFFSSNSADVRSVAAASQQPGIATQLRLDVHARSPRDDSAVIAATKDLAEKLRSTGEFRLVWTGVQTSDLAMAYQRLLATGPILLDEAEQKEVESRATPEFLQKRLAAARDKLADPDGELLLAQVLNDPLDIGGILGHRLKNLSPVGGNAGNTATFEDGALVTHEPATGVHAMIVTEPLSLPSNQKAAEKTLDRVNAAIAETQNEFAAHPVDVWVVGAHRAYVENARRVIADVTRVSVLGSLAVAIAIALYFRRIATAIICIIPASVGIGIALGIAGVFHLQLPLILLGFAGLLCGSTTDYGIQIISEMNRLASADGEGGWRAELPALAARRMLGPISMSVATSVTGFAALGLSDSPGLRALGLFVAAATLSIWIVTFLILPAYMGPWLLPKKSKVGGGENRKSKIAPGTSGLLRWGGCIAFLAITALLTREALHVRFDTDPRSLDGSSPQLRAEEQAFFQTWGNLRDRAVILAQFPSAEDALATAQQTANFCQTLLRDDQITGFISPAGLLPDQPTALARANEWHAYWTPEHLSALRNALSNAAAATGFKRAALDAYADRITTVPVPSAAERIRLSPAALFPGFVDSTAQHTTIASIVAMNPDRPPRLETGWTQELRLRQPGIIILSGKALAFDAVERARAEGERLGPWCFLAILFPLWLYFRRLRRAWLTLTCMLVGFVWVLGSAQLFGNGLNLLSLVPILFTLGVAVDYGIYAATVPAGEQANRLAATFLCASTTTVGSAALLLSGHPAMRWLGITLVAGVTGGYLTSLFIVSPLATRPRRSRVVNWTFSIAAAIATILLTIPVVAEWLLAKQRPTTLQPIPHVAATQIRPNVYQAGNNWLRWRPASPTTGLWEMSLAGTPEERGAAISALAAPIDVRIENEMLKQLDELVPEEWARWTLLRVVGTNLLTLPNYVRPEYQRELYAAALSYDDPHAYLAPAYPRILSYHALHDVSQMLIDNPLIVPNQFACTGVVSLPEYSAAQNGHLMLGRVFDFEGGETFGRQKSLTYVIPPPGEGIPFAHVAWPGLAGCVTGMNAEKIALFLNAAATKDYRRIGTPTIFMARDILQHARSLDDAERIIRGTQVFVSDIIVVADGKTGHARIFEKSPAATAARDVDASAVITNHLTTPTFADDPVNKERMAEGTTMQRYARARQLLDRLHANVTPESLATLLRDKKALDDHDIGYGNRDAIDGLIACHAVIMDVTAGQMWIAAWPNCEGAFVGIDITQMLQNAPHSPDFAASATPPVIEEDPLLHDGNWPRILASRIAQQKSLDALRAHNLPAAITAANEAIANNPSFYFGHELLGRALLQQNETAAATRELQTALALSPPYAKRVAEIQNLLNNLHPTPAPLAPPTPSR